MFSKIEIPENPTFDDKYMNFKMGSKGERTLFYTTKYFKESQVKQIVKTEFKENKIQGLGTEMDNDLSAKLSKYNEETKNPAYFKKSNRQIEAFIATKLDENPEKLNEIKEYL